MDRRTTITDAAIATLAANGMRGFTHRAVDRAADLPEGSTSYYFRTREALLAATLDRMAALDMADAGHLPGLGGVAGMDELTDLLTALVKRWVTTARDRTLARYELSLETARRPELRATMERLGGGFRLMAEQFLRAAGADEPERRGRAMVSYIDGLVFHQILQIGAGEFSPAELRAACRDLLLTSCQQDA